MMESLALVLNALGLGFKAFDDYLKTKYHSRYMALLNIIREEEAKPITGEDNPLAMRDQGKIDNAYIELVVLLREFVRNEKDS